MAILCSTCYSGAVWFFCIFLLYKILDRVVRIPFIRGLQNRYIFVTGCDTGFGHEIAKRLDKKGCHVFAGCLTEKGEVELKKQCSSRLETVSLDVSKYDSVRKAYAYVQSKLPPGKGLHGVLNNAGISGRCGPVEWLIRKDYDEVFGVNLHGLIDVTVTFLPLIKKARGRVVNTSSVFGRTAPPGPSPYCISKYGVQAFSDSLRKEMRPYRCGVHIIEPGVHKTNIINADFLGHLFMTTWDRLSPELKEEYGQEFVQNYKDKIIHEFPDRIASRRISDVVDAYEHALLGMFPRARYVVGTDAKYYWLPVQWLPEWLGDWIPEILLGKDMPLPAVLKKH